MVHAKFCLMQVIDPQSWDMLFGRMKALPPSTRHIVMVTTVPVVYPQVSNPNQALTPFSLLVIPCK